MPSLVSRVKSLGNKFLSLSKEEPDAKSLMKDFLHDLEDIVDAIDVLVDSMDDSFSEQVVAKRSIFRRFLVSMPGFVQPEDLTQEQKKIRDISVARERVHTLSESLEKIDSAITAMPTDAEEMGRRVYSIAYPGQEIENEKLEELEKRLKELETSFLQAFQQINEQMNSVTSSIQDLGESLASQGVTLDRMEQKIEQVDTRLQKAQKTLEVVSKKITQNRALLAFLAGALAIAIVVIVL